MKGIILGLATAIIFLTVGIVCLLWPERIQKFSVGYFTHYYSDEGLTPFLNWMKGQGYIWSLRITGLIGIAGFVLLLIAFAADLKK